MTVNQSIKTFGLTHVALSVRDVERSSRFYQQVFGSVEVYRQDHFAQLQTPGTRDVLVLEQATELAGVRGGIAHFGFRLQNPADINQARDAVTTAGGTVREQGEFVPGEPYLFALDPDGYEFEIWYELPTPVDPPREARRVSKIAKKSTKITKKATKFTKSARSSGRSRRGR